MGSLNNNSSSILPKISKKLAIRTVCLVVVVGGLTYGLEWFLKYRSDLDRLMQSDTAGWIAAVQFLPDGHQAVLISPDGVVHKDAGYKPKTTDRDLAWSPRGNFLYFISDRNEHNFNLFRWAPGSDKPADQRTTGTRARSNPRFSAQPTDELDGDTKALITCGGLVQQFDPSNQTTEQVLPPTTKEIAQSQGGNDDSEKGTEGQFTGAYGSLGTSFREAQWCGGKRFIVGVMRRENGEILIIQDMQPVDGKLPQPRPLTAGDHIDFSVNPKDGSIVYSVQHFQWPDQPLVDANGKPLPKPFVNGLLTFDVVSQKAALITRSDQVAFGAPAIKPDGSSVVVVAGPVENGALTPQFMINFPTKNDPTFKQFKIPGEIHEPSWSPDGVHIVFAVHDKNGKRTIYDLRTDEGSMRNLTGDSGDFAFPMFSPQTKSGS